MIAARKIAPGPRGHGFLGDLLFIRRDRLGFVTRIARGYGDIVRFRMAHRILHLVSHPDYIRHILQDNQANYIKGVGLAQAKRWLGEGLVTSEGEVWARQRRLIQPAFQRPRLAPLAPVVVSATAEMLDRWAPLAARNESLNVAAEMMRLTLAIIARMMFNTDITNASEVGTAFTSALRDAMERMVAIVALPEWLPTPRNLRFKRAIKTLDAIVWQIIREHRAGSSSLQGDLISTLMGERDVEMRGFEDAELRDQVLTILLAGHETTASSLAWTLYLLDKHPDGWTRLVGEVDRVLGERTPTYEDLSQLVWTRMVYDESLRLYPPVWLIPRRALAADTLGGYDIPRNSDVLVSPWALHRHPRYWSDPEVFRPERFSPGLPSDRPRYAYLPFGAGPRACVGSSLATMEALLILAMIAQRYRPRLVPGHLVTPEPLLTLRFRHGLSMKLEQRAPTSWGNR
jgi:cytochrome P450